MDDNRTSPTGRRVLSVFTLAMINVAMIASLRGLPTMAEYGLTAVFFFVVAALVFLIPTALVSAELATGWPRRGGVYVWVKEAWGPRWGFLALWLQWFQNVIWFPTVLSFAAATFAFALSPALADNKFYALAVILAVYWGATLANFRGMRASGLISTVGVIGGTLVPGALIIGLGVAWLALGHPSQVQWSGGAFLPDLSQMGSVVLAASTLLFFAGMEVSATHAQEVKNPRRDYPKAIFVATVVVLAVFVLGTLAIAVVVPREKISLVAGLMQAFTVFLDQFRLAWLIPVVALLIAVGVFGQITTWIAGPSKGLLAVARHGYLPPLLQRVNRHGVQTPILLVQALIVTALSLVFLLMPTVSSSYWILTALTAQLYLVMYVLLFLSALRLRYSEPGVARAYRVPGGKVGIWLVAGVATAAAVFAIALGYFPPAQLQTGSVLFYEAFLVVGMVIVCAVPLLVYQFRRPGWARPVQGDDDEQEAGSGG
ncbi:MAG: amino acid permease [Candidatus Coatesbacteria bacterium]|nr:MAG: amino acid permease [Candidatus Coatesbacteria bacterium]